LGACRGVNCNLGKIRIKLGFKSSSCYWVDGVLGYDSKFVHVANGTIPMEEDMVSFIFLLFFVHMGLDRSFLDDNVIQRDLK
jgi:hypothetical protein